MVEAVLSRARRVVGDAGRRARPASSGRRYARPANVSSASRCFGSASRRSRLDRAQASLIQPKYRRIASIAALVASRRRLEVAASTALMHRLGGGRIAAVGFGGIGTRPAAAALRRSGSRRTARYMRLVARRDDVHVQPQRVELGLLLLVEDQLVERLVVTEIAHQAVEAGVEVAAAILRACRSSSGRAPACRTCPGRRG